MKSGAGNLLFGVVLLLAGVAFSVASENVVWYGAIVVGLINIVRGGMKLARASEGEPPARLAGEDVPAQVEVAAGAEGPKPSSPAETETAPVLDMKDLGRTAGWVLAFAIPAAFFFLLPPLTKSGLWDPYELNVADLGRRLALNLFHADALSLSGADNSLPHLNDLGRPELPFTSMALGFRLFGLHEWAGRLPLAIWGLAGALATFGWVARLVDRRAGIFASVVLCTMPLFFVQARTMLGDVVTMSAISMAFGGLAVGAFGRGDTKAVDAGRVAWTVLGLVALVAGYYSRGLMLGVGAPAVAIGLAWLATWGTGSRRLEPFGDVVGLVALIVGGWASAKGFLACSSTEVSNDLNMAAGAVLHAPQKYPTFDYFIGHLGPAAAPWSAFVPLAMGRMFVAPVGRTGVANERESYARLAILVGGAVAFVAHGWLAARTDLIPFTAPAVLAASCGIALRDYERGAKPSRALAVATMVFLAVFHHDFHELPEKAYQAFGVTGATFPES
ncbi:MAG TPA: glycosyltransferase family 39 protein, partial [Polyangiaceae bacterium]